MERVRQFFAFIAPYCLAFLISIIFFRVFANLSVALRHDLGLSFGIWMQSFFNDLKPLTWLIPVLIVISYFFFWLSPFAFAKNYDDARLLVRSILENSPKYQDVRVLLDRTYAWDERQLKN